MNKPKIIPYNPSTTEPVIGESITINKTIPSKQFKEIFVTDMSVENQQTNEPTLDECIKEWEEKRWKVTKYAQSLKLENFYKDTVINFAKWNKSILIANKNYSLARDIPFDLIPLIHKTLKALEAKKYVKNR